jgi:NADPH-dependent 2,4-dienoyl-CoA reductase/sulfur reductase-like enzyme
MTMNDWADVVVVGGGAAGCAAAQAARATGARAVLLVDLAEGPGGAPAAMGLRDGRADDAALAAAGVERSYSTALLGLEAGPELRLLSPHGAWRVAAGAVVLATGGREQTRGNLALPGTRPAGVLTAGAALRLHTMTGRRPGKRAVVAGAGRWASVVVEMLGRAGVSIAAIVSSVAKIDGWPRITGVVLDDGRRQECDLLVLATPLIPWLPPLAGATGLAGVFVAGCAAQAELNASEAAADGTESGRRAAAWALRDKMTR